MTDTIEGILGFTVFSALILSGLADIILAVTWTKIYFTSGLVLFSRHVPIGQHHTDIPSTSLLNSRLYSFWMGGFIFRELDTNHYGFRRKFFSFAPRPMMHGLLIFDTENHKVVVKGYLDWFMVSFSFVFLVLPFIIAPVVWFIEDITYSPDFLLAVIGAVAFYGLIIGSLYLMDYSRLARITRVATELWSRKYVPSH